MDYKVDWIILWCQCWYLGYKGDIHLDGSSGVKFLSISGEMSLLLALLVFLKFIFNLNYNCYV